MATPSRPHTYPDAAMPGHPRRSPTDRLRRRELAKVASGGSSDATQRFQVVIYLSRTSHAFPELEMRSCEEYALTFGWGIALVVVDDDMELSPDRRPKLQAALKKLKDKEAGAILVPGKATISPLDGEYNEFAEKVEKAGCFIQETRR